MGSRLAHFFEWLRASFWFVPSLLASAAIALAATTLWVDRAFAARLPERMTFPGTADGASTLLATIAGSMISVTGVVFSITVVALSLASAQLGPRLLRNFRRDRFNQAVLGTFTATFLFALVALRAIDRRGAEVFVPRFTTTVAMFLAVVSLGVLIAFIHHVAVAIQADSVVASVAEELERAIRRVFPTEGRSDEQLPDAAGAREVPATRTGYVQTVEVERLAKLAAERDFVVRLLVTPGDFTSVGEPILVVGPVDPGPEFAREAARTIRVGAERTPEQDLGFIAEQIGEIAARALSSGVSDPFTAERCVDRLGAAFALAASRHDPPVVVRDGSGAARLVVRPPRFAELAEQAFSPILRTTSDSPAVAIRVILALERIAHASRDPERRAVVRRLVGEAVAVAEVAVVSGADRTRLDEARERALRAASP